MINSAEFVPVYGPSVVLADTVIPFETIDIVRDIRVTETPRAQEHGIWPAPTYFGKMVITATGDILGNTSVDYNTARMAMLGAFYPYELTGFNYLGTLFLDIAGYGERLSCKCTLEGNPDLPLAALSPSAGKYNFSLKSFDPRFYGETLQNAISSAPLETIVGRTYPKTYPYTYGYTGYPAGAQIITNSGNAESAPIITVYGPGDGIKLVLQIGAIRYVLTFLGAITSTDVVVIDLGNRTAVLNGSSNVYNRLGGQYWKIPPQNSTFTYEPSVGTTISSSRADITWQNAYVY